MTVPKKLTHEFLLCLNPPKQLYPGQRQSFESEVIAEVAATIKMARMIKNNSLPHGTANNSLPHAGHSGGCMEYHFDWEDHPHHMYMAQGTSIQETTGYTPFYLMFGHWARVSVDVMYGPPNLPTRYIPLGECAMRLWRNLAAAIPICLREKESSTW